MGENLLSVLGKPKFQQLVYFSADLPKVKLEGYVTKTVLSGSVGGSGSKLNKEQTFFYLNRRPVEMPKRFRSLFTEVYKQYNSSTSPMLVLNATVEDNNYDINVSPDKREIFLKNEEEAATQLQAKLSEFFEDIQRTKAYDCQSVISAQTTLAP